MSEEEEDSEIDVPLASTKTKVSIYIFSCTVCCLFLALIFKKAKVVNAISDSEHEQPLPKRTKKVSMSSTASVCLLYLTVVFQKAKVAEVILESEEETIPLRRSTRPVSIFVSLLPIC